MSDDHISSGPPLTDGRSIPGRALVMRVLLSVPGSRAPRRRYGRPREITRSAQRPAGSSGTRARLVARTAGSGRRGAVIPPAAVRERERAHTRRIFLDPGAPTPVRSEPPAAPPAVSAGPADA
ncbi:hypothetical protein ACG2OD_02955 [Streptomyces sp. PDY-4]|uniref:hypothetical protein n=1 Tax=Streptomyces sp. PDY-4 TaxID=3376070 RepID=UPI003798B344